MTELPILKKTELITVRHVGDRQAFTYADLADGLQVDAALVRRQYARNAESWNPDETGVSQIDTPSGTQDVRWFTARGAMRFCRYVKSGRSDTIFNHLLDLWEAERNGTVLPRASSPDVAALTASLGDFLPALATKVIGMGQELDTLGTRLAAVEEEQRRVDPRAIEERMFVLHKLKKLLVDGTKDTQQAVTHPTYWRALKEHLKVASFQNRSALTVDLMDQAIEFARNWCFGRGVTPPTLFDEVKGDAAAS